MALGTRFDIPIGDPAAPHYQGRDSKNPDIALTNNQWPMWETASRSCVMYAFTPGDDNYKSYTVPPKLTTDQGSDKKLFWRYLRDWNFRAPANNLPSTGSFNFLPGKLIKTDDFASTVFSVKTGKMQDFMPCVVFTD